MEEAPSLVAIVQPNELVQPEVVLADGGVGGVGLGDDAQLVVGVLAPALVSDLQNAAAIEVVAVPSENRTTLADLAQLISDVVVERCGRSVLGLLGGIAIWVNGNKIPIPKTENRT